MTDARRLGATLPLFSCIMPTSGRGAFVALSIAAFKAQNYPARELLIVGDGVELTDDDARSGIRHIDAPPAMTIGEKRNIGLALARGEYCMQWDDDDWYGPRRISRQALPLITGAARVSGLKAERVLSLPTGAFKALSPEFVARRFPSGFHSGTIAFPRAAFLGGAAYPASSRGEDVAMLRALAAMGSRAVAVDDPDGFLYVRHERNSWAHFDQMAREGVDLRDCGAPAGFPSGLLQRYRDAALACAAAGPRAPVHADAGASAGARA